MGESVNSQITDLATVEHLSESARAKLPGAVATGHQPGDGSEHGGHEGASVREVTYKGHRIRIETSYRIRVDDRPVEGHVMVGNNGSVHYHSIPNQEFRSAVDMVKRIIDLAAPAAGDQPAGHGAGHRTEKEA